MNKIPITNKHLFAKLHVDLLDECKESFYVMRYHHYHNDTNLRSHIIKTEHSRYNDNKESEGIEIIWDDNPFDMKYDDDNFVILYPNKNKL